MSTIEGIEYTYSTVPNTAEAKKAIRVPPVISAGAEAEAEARMQGTEQLMAEETGDTPHRPLASYLAMSRNI